MFRYPFLKSYLIAPLSKVRRKATIVTSVCRMRIAKKKVKRVRRCHRCATKIQKRIRIFIAKRVFALKKLQWYKAMKIQRYRLSVHLNLLTCVYVFANFCVYVRVLVCELMLIFIPGSFRFEYCSTFESADDAY